MHWTDIIKPGAPTLPARGSLTCSVEQARRILEYIGDLTIPSALTFGALLSFARPRHEAALADLDTRRAEWGPWLSFTGSSVRWKGSWTYGRWLTLTASGSQVRVTWDSGTGGPSRFLHAVLAQAGVTYPPYQRETARQVRERLVAR